MHSGGPFFLWETERNDGVADPISLARKMGNRAIGIACRKAATNREMKRYNVTHALIVITLAVDILAIVQLVSHPFVPWTFVLWLNVMTATLAYLAWTASCEFASFLAEKPIRLHIAYAIGIPIVYLASLDIIGPAFPVGIGIFAPFSFWVMSWPPQESVTHTSQIRDDAHQRNEVARAAGYAWSICTAVSIIYLSLRMAYFPKRFEQPIDRVMPSANSFVLALVVVILIVFVERRYRQNRTQALEETRS